MKLVNDYLLVATLADSRFGTSMGFSPRTKYAGVLVPLVLLFAATSCSTLAPDGEPTQLRPSAACISRGTLYEENLKDSPKAVCVGHKVKIVLKNGQNIAVPEVGASGATSCSDSAVDGASYCFTIFTDDGGFPHVSTE